MQGQAVLIASLMVTLSLFVLLGFTVWVLRSTSRPLAPVIKALAVPVGALPAILYALYWLYH
jgi:hypothetical protein